MTSDDLNAWLSSQPDPRLIHDRERLERIKADVALRLVATHAAVRASRERAFNDGRAVFAKEHRDMQAAFRRLECYSGALKRSLKLCRDKDPSLAPSRMEAAFLRAARRILPRDLYVRVMDAARADAEAGEAIARQRVGAGVPIKNAQFVR